MDHLIRPNKSLPLWKSYLNGGGGIRILETLNQIVMEHFFESTQNSLGFANSENLRLNSKLV